MATEELRFQRQFLSAYDGAMRIERREFLQTAVDEYGHGRTGQAAEYSLPVS